MALQGCCCALLEFMHIYGYDTPQLNLTNCYILINGFFLRPRGAFIKQQQ